MIMYNTKKKKGMFILKKKEYIKIFSILFITTYIDINNRNYCKEIRYKNKSATKHLKSKRPQTLKPTHPQIKQSPNQTKCKNPKSQA